MRSVKDKAIILRRKSFGEADWLLTLLTQNHGKIRAVAKGARKVTSRLSGYAELFTVIACQINFQTSIPIISQVSHEQLFDGIAENQNLYRSLCVVAETVDRATHEDDVQPGLFRLVIEEIHGLVAEDRPTALSSALVRLTQQLGIVPQVEICSLCGRTFTVEDRLIWDVVHGGLVHATDSQQVLSKDEVKIIRSLVLQRLPAEMIVPRDLAERSERLLLNHIEFSLDQRLVSLQSS